MKILNSYNSVIELSFSILMFWHFFLSYILPFIHSVTVSLFITLCLPWPLCKMFVLTMCYCPSHHNILDQNGLSQTVLRNKVRVSFCFFSIFISCLHICFTWLMFKLNISSNTENISISYFLFWEVRCISNRSAFIQYLIFFPCSLFN